MTLPKGYKPNTPSRDDDDYNRPTSIRRKRGSLKKGIFFFILFLISLSIFIHQVLTYIQEDKEIKEEKRILEEMRLDYAETYTRLYGKLPPNVPAPP